MSTVEAVSGGVESAADAGGVVVPPEQRAGPDGSALGSSDLGSSDLGTSEPRSVPADAGADRRSLLVPVVAALIAGVFVIAAVGFNVMLGAIDSVRTEVSDLRGDMDVGFAGVRAETAQLRADMNAEIGGVRGEIGGVRGEIAQLRADMDVGFADVRGEIAGLRGDVDARFAEVNGVLLDHTDRLARIEAIHGAHSHVSAGAGPQG